MGAVVGGPFGALVGAGLGALLGTDTLTLEDALRGFLAERELEFVSLRSGTKSDVTIVFRAPSGDFRSIVASVKERGENVDDDLYDAAVAAFAKWTREHEQQLAR